MDPSRAVRDHTVYGWQGPVAVDEQSSARVFHVRQQSMAADQSYSAVDDWHQVFRRICSRTTWITALKMQALVIRNAAGSIACAWIPSACCALGNIFSGKWYTEQSRSELMLANCVWGAITFCTVVFASFLLQLLSFHFVNGRTSVWFCFKQLVRATARYFGATLGVIFAFNCLIAYLSSITPSLFKYKIDCYVDTIALIGYVAGIGRAVLKIYQEETRQGRDGLQRKRQQRKRSQVLPTEHVAPLPVRRLALQEPSQSQIPTFWRAYVKVLPVASSPILACVFVHVLSRQRLVDSSTGVLTGFVVVSIALKLAVQEAAKLYIFRKRVISARIMCVLVGIPTVLIDTQTRIILLGRNSTRTATMGAIGMAVIEISLRAGKAALLTWEIRHRKASLQQKHAAKLQQQEAPEGRPTGKRVVARAPNTLHSSLSSRVNNFEVWRRQAQTFHMAELNADMYAEYISIGCSASVLFFYGNHPHYWLLRQSGNSETAAANAGSWRMSQLGMLFMQISVEVVVDYASIVLEVMIGVEFEHTKKMGSFLASMFMIAAVMNSAISIGFYLS